MNEDFFATDTPPVLDAFSTPSMWYRANGIAAGAKRQRNVADYIPQLMRGVPPEAIAQVEKKDAQAKRAMEIVQGFAAELEGLDPEQIDAILKSNPGKVTEAVKPGAPTYKNPKMRSPGTIEMLLSALGAAGNPRYASQILAAPFEAEINAYGMRKQEADRQYERETDAYNRQQQLDSAAAGRQQDWEMFKLREAGDREQWQANLAAQQKKWAEDRMARAQEMGRQDVARLWLLYKDEKNPAKLPALAERLRKMDPEFAPTEDEVKQAQAYMTRNNLTEAQKAFRDSYMGLLNAYGEVPDAMINGLELGRAALARQYGINDPKQLGVLPTGATFRKKIAEAMDARAKELQSFKIQDYKTKWANAATSLAHAAYRLALAARGQDIAAAYLARAQFDSSWNAYLKALEGMKMKVTMELALNYLPPMFRDMVRDQFGEQPSPPSEGLQPFLPPGLPTPPGGSGLPSGNITPRGTKITGPPGTMNNNPKPRVPPKAGAAPPPGFQISK